MIQFFNPSKDSRKFQKRMYSHLAIHSRIHHRQLGDHSIHRKHQHQGRPQPLEQLQLPSFHSEEEEHVDTHKWLVQQNLLLLLDEQQHLNHEVQHQLTSFHSEEEGHVDIHMLLVLQSWWQLLGEQQHLYHVVQQQLTSFHSEEEGHVDIHMWLVLQSWWQLLDELQLLFHEAQLTSSQ